LSDPTEFTDEPIETGLVTATVTESVAQSTEQSDAQPVELTPEAIQAAKALVNLPDISPVTLAQLAREIAQDIGMLPAILQKHKLTQPQYDFLEKHNAFFRSILTSEIKNWQSIKSTEVRLRLQAQAALEQQMPSIANRMGNAAEKLGDVVEAFKAFSRVAGVDAPQNGPVAAGERFSINIDLGADTRIVIGTQTPAQPGADTHQHASLPANSQGPSDDIAMAKIVGQT
jgi:hypothetical protein